MTDKAPGWDRKRLEKLRASLSESEIEALARRAKADPRSLSLDEIGVLFLVTRERLRAIEGKSRRKGR